MFLNKCDFCYFFFWIRCLYHSQTAAKEKWEGSQQDEFLERFEKLLTTNKNGDGFFVEDEVST